MRKPCSTPGCSTGRVTESRFCRKHTAMYAKIREELAQDVKIFGKYGKRKKPTPTCCRPGCYEVRLGTDAYCDSCTAAGYVEEAA